jgi:flagellar protein FliS
MNLNRAISQYADVNATSQASHASHVDLIIMLFDGLSDALTVAQGHIQHGSSLALKNKALQRANAIICGLLDGLDLENGGDLALNLQSLYFYMIKKLIHVNAYNDIAGLEEIKNLVNEIAAAWREVPSLIHNQTPAKPHYLN